MDNKPAPDAVVDARLAELRARFPDLIGESDEPLIRVRMERSLRQADGIRTVPLSNGDQPFVSIAALGDTGHAE